MRQDRGSKSAEDRVGPARAAENQATAAYAGSRVGADLRAARERLGWTLPAISAQLRIRLPFLEAIEAGRIDDLPGNAYAVGFVRTYGQALGLDPDEIGRRFRSEAADINRKTDLAFPVPVPERGIPLGALVLIGGLIALGAYVGWYKMSGDGRPVTENVQPVPTRLAPMADKAAAKLAADTPVANPPAAPVVPAAPSVPAPSVPPSSAAAAIPASPSVYGQPPAVLPGSAPPSPPATQVLPASSAPPGAGKPTGLTDTTHPDASRSDKTRVILRARADAWMQVRERPGGVLLNRVMRSGETWPVPIKPNLFLTTGNAGGTEIVLDGTTLASLGGDGAVRRDIALDPDGLKGVGPGAQPGVKPVAPKPQ